MLLRFDRLVIPGVFTLAVLIFTACASAPEVVEEDDGSQADGAAYRTDAMHIRTPMPDRPVKQLRFYFKDCAAIGEQTHYSKTSYSCSGP